LPPLGTPPLAVRLLLTKSFNSCKILDNQPTEEVTTPSSESEMEEDDFDDEESEEEFRTFEQLQPQRLEEFFDEESEEESDLFQF
jgi:hypothetical protein